MGGRVSRSRVRLSSCAVESAALCLAAFSPHREPLVAGAWKDLHILEKHRSVGM